MLDACGTPPADAVLAAIIAACSEIAHNSAALREDGRPIPAEFIVRAMAHQEAQQRMTIKAS